MYAKHLVEHMISNELFKSDNKLITIINTHGFTTVSIVKQLK